MDLCFVVNIQFFANVFDYNLRKISCIIRDAHVHPSGIYKIVSSSACTTDSSLVSETFINQTNIVKLSLHVKMYSFPLSYLGLFHNDLYVIKLFDNLFFW